MASNLLDVGAGGETAQTLYFVSFAPSILTSDIVEQSGDDWAKRFRVTTDDSQSPQLTTIYDLRRGEEQVLARIEWQGHPVVEIRDILGRQSARSWLGLVPDRRNMEASGIKYIWAPYLDDICVRRCFRALLTLSST
ncbi:hypothetical protein PUNSTDRAFT_68489 [Punctularia strigosozonata HHB-11173 SS5]|uniref:uncharacterized protein n=1 Tax=Punctularia strigosozonata (strain HHB-11173) TaxID=741275 RepID=UPI000441797E|nr:uncharacterized protein PUNSTDRAFT_68489 [Punctularia strigosozonata HHB-11173 SS5]EIN08496.1 hypothetical protein PUNSTDRAFT_68489 [Punctularia strigosozonata HHB-11173 SS5]